MTNRRASDGRRASVSIRQVPAEEMFRLRNEGRKERIVEQLDHLDESHDSEGGVTTWQMRPGTVTMYKPVRTRPDGTKDYQPRTVSVTAISLLLQNGWSENCPTCGGQHLDREGNPTNDPNACSAVERSAVRVCPVCGHRIYDNLGTGAADFTGEDDPNVIAADTVASTPAERTLMSLHLHMWHWHKNEAMMRGIPPLPTAIRDALADARPV